MNHRGTECTEEAHRLTRAFFARHCGYHLVPPCSASVSSVPLWFIALIGRACRIPLRDPKHLNASIVRVADVQFAIVTDESSRGQPEFAEVGASLAERQQEVSLPIEELDVVENAVHDIDDTVPVHCQPLGIARSPEPSP